MKLYFDKILFWGIALLVSIYVLYHLGVINNTYENFVADIDEYVDTGYGNQYLETNKPDQSLLTDTQTLLGHDMPLADFKDAPLEDGQHQMFMFAKNKCSPKCCPSTYSCAGGCVCTTEQQRNLINTRG
jgi:hypothetical protein